MQEQSRQAIESKGREPGTCGAPRFFCDHGRRFLFELQVDSLPEAYRKGAGAIPFFSEPFLVTKSVTLQNGSSYLIEDKQEGK
jgi:hypothetical protein